MTIIRNMILLSVAAFSAPAFPLADQAGICLKNNSITTYTYYSLGIDNYDWEDIVPGSMLRPDYVLNNVKLGPGDIKCVDLNYNAWSNAAFNLEAELLGDPVQTRFGNTRIFLKTYETNCDRDRAGSCSTHSKWEIRGVNQYPQGRLHRGGACPDQKYWKSRHCSLFIIQQ